MLSLQARIAADILIILVILSFGLERFKRGINYRLTLVIIDAIATILSVGFSFAITPTLVKIMGDSISNHVLNNGFETIFMWHNIKDYASVAPTLYISIFILLLIFYVVKKVLLNYVMKNEIIYEVRISKKKSRIINLGIGLFQGLCFVLLVFRVGAVVNFNGFPDIAYNTLVFEALVNLAYI